MSKTAYRPGTTALRPIGLPRPIQVRTDADGLPVAVARPAHGPAPRSGRTVRARPGGHADLVPVESIEEAWRVAEEWWREDALERTYYLLLLQGGRPITIFHDPHVPPSGGWFEQRY